MKSLQLVIILFLFLSLNLNYIVAQTSTPNSIAAFRIDSKIQIDGNLNEAEWEQA